MTTHTPELKQSRMVNLSPVYYGWIVWAVATVGWIASSPGQSFTVSLFFDSFINDFGLSRTTVSALYGLGTFTASLALTYVGRLVDRFGNRRMGVVIAAGFAIALMLLSFVTGPISLLLGFMAIRGFGQGSMTLVNTTVIAEWFKRLRGRMMSYSLVGFALFQAAYVPWVQQQIELHGWRQVWVMLGIGVFVMVVPLTLLLMRNRPEDYGLLPDGMTDTDDNSELVLEELQNSWTLQEAMRTVIFWVFVVGRILSPAWGTGLIIHQVSIFETLGYEARVAAETYALITLISAATAIFFGIMVDRVKAGWVMAIQLVALIVALLSATVMTTEPLRVLYAASFGFVIGGGGVFDGAAWTNVFGRAHQGAIRGFVMTVLVIGTSIGPVIFGWTYDTFGNYDLVLWVGSAFCAVTMVASLIVKMPKRKREAA